MEDVLVLGLNQYSVSGKQQTEGYCQVLIHCRTGACHSFLWLLGLRHNFNLNLSAPLYLWTAGCTLGLSLPCPFLHYLFRSWVTWTYLLSLVNLPFTLGVTTRLGVFLVAQLVKNPPAMQETWVQSLGWEDPLEEDMATHFSILAWRLLIDRGACGL